MLNALFYVLRMGCAWRWLPHDYPAWRTVYHYFRAWRKDGTWERIHHKLYQLVWVSEGRDPTPSAAVLDSQSVETATMVSKAVGFDAGKLVKGRKRHLLVDTLGLVMMIVVTAGSVTEWDGARQVFARVHQIRQRFPRLVRIWVDGGYRGKDFIHWVMDSYRWVLEVVIRREGVKGSRYCPDDGSSSVPLAGLIGVAA